MPHLQEVSAGFQEPAHPDESCVEPALHPAQRLHQSRQREGTTLRCGGDYTFKIKYSLQQETQPSRPGFPPSLWLPGVRLLLPSLGRDEETQEGGAQGQEGLLL